MKLEETREFPKNALIQCISWATHASMRSHIHTHNKSFLHLFLCILFTSRSILSGMHIDVSVSIRRLVSKLALS
jgi:hypothetical protein